MTPDIRSVSLEDSEQSSLEELYSMFAGDVEEMLSSVVNKNLKFPPLDILPCANVDVERHFVCEKPGKLACSSCKLVSYCSKVCCAVVQHY